MLDVRYFKNFYKKYSFNPIENGRISLKNVQKLIDVANNNVETKHWNKDRFTDVLTQKEGLELADAILNSVEDKPLVFGDITIPAVDVKRAKQFYNKQFTDKKHIIDTGKKVESIIVNRPVDAGRVELVNSPLNDLRKQVNSATEAMDYKIDLQISELNKLNTVIQTKIKTTPALKETAPQQYKNLIMASNYFTTVVKTGKVSRKGLKTALLYVEDAISNGVTLAMDNGIGVTSHVTFPNINSVNAFKTFSDNVLQSFDTIDNVLSKNFFNQLDKEILKLEKNKHKGYNTTSIGGFT